MRELGLSLADVRRVLDGQVTVAEVAAVHLEALDAQIRTLRLRRAVLAAVVKRAVDGKEMTAVNKLARLSVAERRQIIDDDFLDEVFQALEPSPAGAARWSAGPNLPEDPSPEQVDAWVELAELVGDRDFRQRIRQVSGYGVQAQAGDGLLDFGWAQENAGAAAVRGCPPDSSEAAQVVERILAPTADGQHRTELLARLEARL